jgi:hypothetical protein
MYPKHYQECVKYDLRYTYQHEVVYNRIKNEHNIWLFHEPQLQQHRHSITGGLTPYTRSDPTQLAVRSLKRVNSFLSYTTSIRNILSFQKFTQLPSFLYNSTNTSKFCRSPAAILMNVATRNHVQKQPYE